MADILKMLDELRQEREGLNEAILVMERLAAGGSGKRLGRPPLWMAKLRKGTQASGPRRGRPPGSKNKVKEITEA